MSLEETNQTQNNSQTNIKKELTPTRKIEKLFEINMLSIINEILSMIKMNSILVKLQVKRKIQKDGIENKEEIMKESQKELIKVLSNAIDDFQVKMTELKIQLEEIEKKTANVTENEDDV